jgi:hypothetical protein
MSLTDNNLVDSVIHRKTPQVFLCNVSEFRLKNEVAGGTPGKKIESGELRVENETALWYPPSQHA